MNKEEALKQYFGHAVFRSGQETIIDHILTGQDVLCVMPTGAGKSICYQIPALLMDGVAVVISPLISLMKDQVNALIQAGVKAAYLNSSLTPSQYDEVLRRAVNGQYKIIYVAPERLITDSFMKFSGSVQISMLAVDEAHCVSHWGQEFRPSYLKIVEFIEKLAYRPVISAFTATATKEVKEDIACILRQQNPFLITTGFNRENLYFEVRKPKNKKDSLLEIIRQNQEKSGLVYCSTRKTVEEVWEYLCKSGFSATRYHAGLGDMERKDNQEAFVHDQKQIMVATNAFGMGIDKSNVSYVVHYNMPKSIESYYQEAGRSGRDGEPAQCILLYSGLDVRTNQFLIENTESNPELDAETQLAIKDKEKERLKYMTFYCSTNDCLRADILKYFGEKTANYCGNCSNCNTKFDTVEITVEAQKILSCVSRVNQNYGIKMVIDVLRGSKSDRLKRLGFEKLSTYGIMLDTSEKKLRDIIDFLVMEQYLSVTNTEYPTLKLTSKSREILFERKSIFMKQAQEIRKETAASKTKGFSVNIQLFEVLKELRKEFARGEHVPAYVVFTDASLRDMCLKLPRNQDEFLTVSGVGLSRQNKYGEQFIAAINTFLES